MEIASIEGLTRVFQASISPVALVSGVGLILLSQTNRFGRVTDRLRELARERRAGREDSWLEAQISTFYFRARLLRMAISFAVGSVLLASFLVLCVFAMATFGCSLHLATVILFALSLICLIASLTLFLADVHLSLKAVQEELRS